MLYGYDTVVVAVGLDGQVGYDLAGGWDGEHVTGSADGRRTAWFATREGVRFAKVGVVGPGHAFYELRAECSLPKLLWGNNVQTLTDLGAGIDRLAQVVAEYCPGLPDVRQWVVRRLDATGDMQLGSQERVGAVLARLALKRIHGRGPVRGQDGSVSWPSKRGGLTRKAYDKYRESGAIDAYGQLRVEVGAIGQRGVRYGLGLPDDQTVQVEDVLSIADAAESICGPFRGLVEQVAGEVEQVTVLDVFEELLSQGKRPDTALRLIGAGVLVGTFGWDVLSRLDRVTLWRYRRMLEESGVPLEELDVFAMGKELVQVADD